MRAAIAENIECNVPLESISIPIYRGSCPPPNCEPREPQTDLPFIATAHMLPDAEIEAWNLEAYFACWMMAAHFGEQMDAKFQREGGVGVIATSTIHRGRKVVGVGFNVEPRWLSYSVWEAAMLAAWKKRKTGKCKPTQKELMLLANLQAKSYCYLGARPKGSLVVIHAARRGGASYAVSSGDLNERRDVAVNADMENLHWPLLGAQIKAKQLDIPLADDNRLIECADETRNVMAALNANPRWSWSLWQFPRILKEHRQRLAN